VNQDDSHDVFNLDAFNTDGFDVAGLTLTPILTLTLILTRTALTWQGATSTFTTPRSGIKTIASLFSRLIPTPITRNALKMS